MGKVKVETHGPVDEVLKALGWTVWQWAAASEVDYSVASHARSYYFAKLPPALMGGIGPFLEGVGQSEERLQKEYSAWRASLCADIRRRGDKFAKAKSIYPGLESGPQDEELHDAILSGGNGKR
jgi:hypothetical protein